MSKPPLISLETLVPGHQEMLASPAIASNLGTQVPVEKFLRFAIATGQELLLPLGTISEVQKLALVDVLPVPYVPTWVLGVHYSRGQVIWVVDLGHLMGERLSYQPGNGLMQCMMILLAVAGQRLGLAVATIHDMENFSVTQFQTPQPGILTPRMEEFISGYEADSGLMVLAPQRFMHRQILSPGVESMPSIPF